MRPPTSTAAGEPQSYEVGKRVVHNDRRTTGTEAATRSSNQRMYLLMPSVLGIASR